MIRSPTNNNNQQQQSTNNKMNQNHQVKFYDNICDPANMGKQINELTQLNEHQIYVVYAGGELRYGPLIKKTITPLPSNNTDYINIFFHVGQANYDGTKMQDQINQFHFQLNKNACYTKDFIYEYYMDRALQEQIKKFKYYKNAATNICKENAICEDVERKIQKYLH